MENAAKTLLVVTLSLEDALARQDTEEADCLIRRRQELLDSLQGRPLSPEVVRILRRTAESEKRLLANLSGARAALAERLRDRARLARAGRAYASASAASGRGELGRV